jgi:endonuclease/exonuclease/phosphatase (EEP) superfamily protein YafD
MADLRARFRGLLTAAAAIGFAASAVAWLHPWLPWWAELPIHLTVQHALALVVVGLGLACARAWRWASACALLAVLHLMPPLTVMRPVQRGARPDLRMLVANVLTSNEDPQRLLALIARERPDAIALVEVDDAWIAALEPLRGDYPHRVVETRDDNFGVALFSRLPFAGSTILHIGGFELPVIDATLAGDRAMRVVVAHPPPPVSSDHSEVRDAMLAALAGRIAADGRTVVVGDLNCTAWAAPFRALLRDGRLRDSHPGWWREATWPAPLGMLGIPIDQVLTGEGVVVTDRRVGESIGSDHLPIIVGLRATE